MTLQLYSFLAETKVPLVPGTVFFSQNTFQTYFYIVLTLKSIPNIFQINYMSFRGIVIYCDIKKYNAI